MKTKKKTIAIMLIATLLVTLIGCDKSDNNENAITQLSDVKEEYVSEGEIASIVIRGNIETNFKDQIVKEIVVARNMTEENESYGNYLSNRVPDIEEFYFQNIEIDGFELSIVEISKHGYHYYYSSKELSEEERQWYWDEKDIQITISRPETSKSPFSLEVFAKNAEENGSGRLTEDNMVYSDRHNEIVTEIGNTKLTIRVPPHMSKYEILRDLANDVINSAELVIVDGYKLPETKEPPVTDKPEIVTTAEWKEVATEVATDMVEWEYEVSTTVVEG